MQHQSRSVDNKVSEVNANLSAGPIPVSVAPDVLADIQAEFSREWQRLCDDARQGALPPPSDRRFAGPAWAAQARTC